MKKHCFYFVAIIFLLAAQHAYTKEIHAIGFFNPVCEGVDKAGLNLSSIRVKFEQIFQQYSTFKVVDISNEDAMAQLQAENNMIGGLEAADAIASIFLQGIGEEVSIQLKVVDAKTNTILSVGDYKMPTQDLYNVDALNVALGTISAKVLQDLGVSLSSTTIAILEGKKNSEELSSEELNEQVANLGEQISNLKNQIAELKKKGAGGLNTSKINKLQIELDKWESKKLIEERRLARRVEDERRKKEESESAAKRSIEANERILAQTRKYEQYATRVRKEQMKALSALEQIEAVEDIKQKLLAMRMYTADEIEKVKNQEKTYAQEECKKIDDEPFHPAEMHADGSPILEVVAKREAKKKKINAEAATKIAKYRTQAKKKQSAFEKKVFADIKKNYAIMRKTKSINSVNNEEVLRLRIGNYDGARYGWQAKISFDLGYKNVAEYSILIPYRAIFKKRARFDSEEYRNNVEDYDSFFRNNIPVLYASVDYSILPLKRDKPSQYLIKIFKTSIYKLETDEHAQPTKIMEKKELIEGYYEADIVSDIRTEEEKSLDAEKERAEMAKQERITEQEKKKVESKEKSEERAQNAKEMTKDFFKPAWVYGVNVGVQTLSFNYDSSRAFMNTDLSLFKPLFVGMEVAFSKAKEWRPEGAGLENTFKYIDIIAGIRLGYRFFGIKNWFSPYLCMSGGAAFNNVPTASDHGARLKTGYSGYVAGSVGFNFLTRFGIFGLGYSCEYNSAQKSLQHLIGFSIGLNIIDLYPKDDD